MAELLRNPTAIGDLFFSGSQAVTKGNEVTWILDDTFAFKATEPCRVSTNASPFVNLAAGQTFLIYKRTEEDITEGNTKGIYLFDRDTIIALAYPQEVSQEIIVQNENYNDFRAEVSNYNQIQNDIQNQVDNYNTVQNDIQNQIQNNITVDALASVVAEVAIDGTIKVNYPIDAVGSYRIKEDYRFVSESWHENGIELATTGTFSYTPTTLGAHTLYYTVMAEDIHGHPAVQTSSQARWVVNAVANVAPVARITGGSSTITVGETLKLSGYSSTDNDGTIASYAWFNGTTSIGSGRDFEYAPPVGIQYIKLKVTDNDGGIGETQIRVAVNAIPNVKPIARITGGVNTITVGGTLNLSGTSSTDSDGTITLYRWYDGTTHIWTGSTLTYKPPVGTRYIKLLITDNDGATGETQIRVVVNAKPVYKDLVFNKTYKTLLSLTTTSLYQTLSASMNLTGTGRITVSCSTNLWTVNPRNTHSVTAYLYINGTLKASGVKVLSKGFNGNTVHTITASYNGTLSSGDIVTVKVKDANASATNYELVAVGGSTQPSDQVQVKITNRTA